MNAGGRAQALADLTVYTAPVFLQEPTSKTVGKGTDVSFRCVVAGNPPPVFSWSKIQVGWDPSPVTLPMTKSLL